MTLPLTQQARTAKLMLLGRFFSQFTAQPTNAGGRVNDPPLQRVCAKLKFAHLMRKETALLRKAGPFVCLLDYRAALAFSTTAAKAAASWMASSDRLLRFISIPAFFTPFMNLE